MAYRRLELGIVEFTFAADIKYKTHRRSASRFVDKVSRRFDAIRRHGIFVGDYFIPSEAIFLDPKEMGPGSIKAVATVVTIISGLGSLTANYSEIKEELPTLFSDIRDIAKNITDDASQNWPPSRVLYPKEVAIRPRSTEDLLRELGLDLH